MITAVKCRCFKIALIGVLIIMLACDKDKQSERTLIITTEVKGISFTSVTVEGYIEDDGKTEIKERGVMWSPTSYATHNEPTNEEGSGAGTFISIITDLEPDSNYYVNAYAFYDGNRWLGNAIMVKTLKALADLSTIDVVDIKRYTAKSGGNITNEGIAPVTARGICWGLKSEPTIDDNKTEDGTGAGKFTSTISNLLPNSTYYVRAYAINSEGIAYGKQKSFTTTDYTYSNEVSDIDGNQYKTIVIGTQEWMAKNLRTTKYQDGTSIPTGHTDEQWAELTTGAYAISSYTYGGWINSPVEGINSDEEMLEAYGALYNWYAVESGKLCPLGWHVPSDDDWTILLDYVVAHGYPNESDNPNGAGNALKSRRQTWSPFGDEFSTDDHPRWQASHNSRNNDGIDAFSFSALPGGYRGSNGGSFMVGFYGYWWSSSEADSLHAWPRILDSSSSYLMRYIDNSKRDGFSVRCVRDNETKK